MNRADHFHTVLGIIETVFLLKCLFIMGGMIATISTGLLLASTYGFSLTDWSQNSNWINAALVLSFIIFTNSWIIFYFLLVGRRGKRSLMRIVPPFGYTNIGLIVTVIYLMATKPDDQAAIGHTAMAVLLIALANITNIAVKLRRARRIRNMSPEDFAALYFGLLNAEKMTDLLKLFRDDAEFLDPFATAPVRGILAIENFFQKLGDQFDSIKILPKKVSGEKDHLLIEWEANGITQNGGTLKNLVGTNSMQRSNGKISRVNIDFNLDDLPTIQRVAL
ncbi:MAG: nuclear transport factor 2 family protein [Exilibacterium sp.]